MKQEYEDLQQKHKQFRKLLDEVEELNAQKRNLMNQLFDARTLDPSVKASIGRIADDMKEEIKNSLKYFFFEAILLEGIYGINSDICREGEDYV